MQAWVVQGGADADGLPAAADGLPAAALGEPAGGGGPPADGELLLPQAARARVTADVAIKPGIQRMAR
jgi:hypothetical protein